MITLVFEVALSLPVLAPDAVAHVKTFCLRDRDLPLVLRWNSAVNFVVVHEVKAVNWKHVSRLSCERERYVLFLVQRWATEITGWSSSILSSCTKWKP